MKEFLLSFIPIFVAMDAIGILPMFIGFTEHLKKKEKDRRKDLRCRCLYAGDDEL